MKSPSSANPVPRALLLALLATPVLLPLTPAASAALVPGETRAEANAGGYITIVRDMNTGFTTYESTLSFCAMDAYPTSVFVHCDLGHLGTIPRECAKGGTLTAAIVSVSHGLDAAARCESYNADCYTYSLDVNHGVCEASIPPPYWVIDAVVNAEPWWDDVSGSREVSCGGWEQDIGIGTPAGRDGVYTVTCTFF